MKQKNYKQGIMINLILTAIMFIMTPMLLLSSSHREAPLISNDPLADNVDLYVFKSPDNPNTMTLIATYVPLQLPYGGPNYHGFGENVRYEIHVDNDASIPGDEIIYRFTFNKTNEDPSTFFNIRLGLQNLKTTYTLERSMDGGISFETIIEDGYVPPTNIGPRSIESAIGLNRSYEDLYNQAITQSSSGERVFAGPTDDPFFVDLGGIFDLGNAPRQVGKAIDNLACLNVSAIAIQVPIGTLLKSGANSTPSNILDSDYVIGVWASASRPAIKTIGDTENPSYSGDWVQVSRLGMPLTNEAVIPIGYKDFWNSITPYDEITETDMDEFFYNPELALYMDDDLFGGAVPSFSKLRVQSNSLGVFDFTNGADGLYILKGDPALDGTALDDNVFGTLLLPDAGKPRSVDLWPAFHTGVPNVIPYQLATGKAGNPLAAGKPFVNNFLPNGGDMLRVNMAVPHTPRDDAFFSSLGLIQAAAIGLTAAPFNESADLEFIPNMDGFPNGRRLEDDVTRIELQAVSGAVLAAVGLWYDDYDPMNSASPVTEQLLNVLGFTTGVEANDKAFRSTFPYLALPHRGTDNCKQDASTNGATTNNQTEISSFYASSNTQGKATRYSVKSDGRVEGKSFSVRAQDADGIYYDEVTDQLIQLNRSANTLDQYSMVETNTSQNVLPNYENSSSSDFSNGREIAVADNRIIVAQDANDGNGNQNKLVVYQRDNGSLTLKQSFNLDINLWGIFADVNTLYAIVDNSNRLAVFNNLFENTEENIMPDRVIEIEGLVRTHGIFYDKETDYMVLTDVGEASSATDGALFLVANFGEASNDGMITSDEYVVISGDQTELGNPVDIAYDPFSNLIHVAERAQDGGKILSFQNGTSGGNIKPVSSVSMPGASAVFLTGSEIEGAITTSTSETELYDDEGLKVYPNPTNQYVNIEAIQDLSEVKEQTLKVFNLTGQLMHHQSFNGKAKLDVSDFLNGIYIISVESENHKSQNIFSKM